MIQQLTMSSNINPPVAVKRKRKNGIPTGNAGEYFVMGELLRRGYDAQLADRNTKGYDILIGRPEDPRLMKVQVKTVRSAPWYIRLSDFEGAILNQITVYVPLGSETAKSPVRYFIARNRDVKDFIHKPSTFNEHGFMPLKHLQHNFEDDWDIFMENDESSQKILVPGSGLQTA